nr:amino acid permease [Bacillus sp. 1NLA3E]
MSVFYVFINYSIIQGFSNQAEALLKSSNPFIALANKYLGSFSVLATIAGFTSIFGMTIACLNGFSRIPFHSAREGLFHRKIAKVSKWGTPIGSLTLLSGSGLFVAIIFGLLSNGWVTGFGYLGTLGTIPLLLIYSLLNLAVIFYKKEKWPFHKKYLFPILGLISILVPLWAMIQPGQPAPVSYFPWGILLLCIASFIYSWFKLKKKSSISSNIGAFEVTVNKE